MIIAGTDIPYIAMWAMLLAVRHHNQYGEQKINTIAAYYIAGAIANLNLITDKR